MSSSAYANNKTKSILILCQRFTQGSEDITLYAEKMYSINFTAAKKKILFKLYRIIMKLIAIYLLMVQKLLNLKQKILKL